MTTKGNIRSIQCPKMVLHNYAHNMLILQAHLYATMLTEKVCFFGRMALWHQITRILTKPPIWTVRVVYTLSSAARGHSPQPGGVLPHPPGEEMSWGGVTWSPRLRHTLAMALSTGLSQKMPGWSAHRRHHLAGCQGPQTP